MPCPRLGRGMLMRGRRPAIHHIFFAASTWTPFASQSFAFLAMVKLWPLQSFLPLQSWAALLQLPLPLQSFVPSQWTPFIAFALPAKATAGAIKVASAPAIATPFNVPFFILGTSSSSYSTCCWRRRGRARRDDNWRSLRQTVAAPSRYARKCHPVSLPERRCDASSPASRHGSLSGAGL